MKREKKELLSAFEKHKQNYFIRKQVIKGILGKYNTKYHYKLLNWREMDVSRLCVTDQNKITSWLRRKGDVKIPNDNTAILTRLKHETLKKNKSLLL